LKRLKATALVPRRPVVLATGDLTHVVAGLSIGVRYRGARREME
jgi:hypothetical protein